MSFSLKQWWSGQARFRDQHPVAHALGGLVFVSAAAFDLWLWRHHGYALLLTVAAFQLMVAVPIVRTENQKRPLAVRVIAASLGLTLGLTYLLAVLLPWAWKPWVVATGAQTVWELLQRSAWLNSTGHSTYPWQSVALDAGTASAVAALLTVAWRVIVLP
jgi:hypothetical protein